MSRCVSALLGSAMAFTLVGNLCRADFLPFLQRIVRQHCASTAGGSTEPKETYQWTDAPLEIEDKNGLLHHVHVHSFVTVYLMVEALKRRHS